MSRSTGRMSRGVPPRGAQEGGPVKATQFLREQWAKSPFVGQSIGWKIRGRVTRIVGRVQSRIPARLRLRR